MNIMESIGKSARKLRRQISRVDYTPDGTRRRTKFDRLKHMQRIVNRLYASKYSIIRISPGFLKVKEGETIKNLYYLHQYHPENKRESKESFGNIIFFEAKTIEGLRDVLQKVAGYDKSMVVENPDNKSIVDEWQIESE